MICVFCHKGLKDGYTLHRINEKGVPGIWDYWEHRSLSDKHFDPDLLELFINNIDIFVQVKENWKDHDE